MPVAPILLLLPLADAASLVPLSHLLGGWLWAWLAGGALFGVTLLRQAREATLRQRARAGEAQAVQGMLDHQRTVLAGLLLLWPGLLTDVAGALLLLTAPPVLPGAHWEHPARRPRQP